MTTFRDDQEAAACVDAASLLVGLTLAPDARDRVVAQFKRLGEVAAPLLALDLPDDVEIAPVFRP